jgi:excisionase family DNA binding protein
VLALLLLREEGIMESEGIDREEIRRNPPAVMNVPEAAAYLDLGIRTIYNLAARGELPAVKVAGAWRIPRSALDEWIETGARAALDQE